MNPVSDRIRAVVAELQHIQDELQAERPAEAALADVPAVAELKNYVDNLRHFLWVYLEAMTPEGPGNGSFDTTLQNYRMRRVTEMLRVLRAQIEHLDAETTPEAPSFFEELMLAADAVCDRNLARAKEQES